LNLSEFFTENPKAAVAFSGGCDSSYLLYAAKTHGCDLQAYFIKSDFQPDFELEDAKALAERLNIPLTVIDYPILDNPTVTENGPLRCYHCKRALFSAIAAQAAADGYTLILDGTNASDDAGDRPGMRALSELGVRSPLRECGLSKADIRVLSREAGLETADKPAYACLATRIPEGTVITGDNLKRVEAAEGEVAALGFSDFRVRVNGNMARLQLPEAQFPLAVSLREALRAALLHHFDAAVLDLTVRERSI